MADYKIEMKIGYRQAFKAITVGLIIAYLIMALLAGPLWIFEVEYTTTMIFAAVVAYVAAYFVGGLTGFWILEKKYPPILFGIVGGFLIVWSATLIASLIGFFNEGLKSSNSFTESLIDYVYKPIALVSTFGLIPIVLVGIWFGLSIKRIGAIQRPKP